MIMYKLGISLVPAEEIGYYLGLVVPPESAHLFYNAHVSQKQPAAGYGTRIYLNEFEPNKALQRADIPLRVTQKLVSTFDSPAAFAIELRRIERADADALLCFNQGVLTANPEKDWGHVVVFDRLVDTQLRLVDPSPTDQKWQVIDIETMFSAMAQHGDERSGGVWLVERTDVRKQHVVQ